jgi:mutator protein MutT
MTRELREELAVEADVQHEMLSTSHDYPDRRVELHFLRCALAGDAVPQQGQEMRWVSREDLATLEFPPADAELIRMLMGRGAGL